MRYQQCLLIYSLKIREVSVLEAFEDRLSGDYDIISTITKEKNEETLKKAKEFLKETKKYLGIK